jgi:hypothetical protein
MPAKISVLRELEEELRSIPLPDGIRWLDDDVVHCILGHGLGAVGGFTAQFVSWLIHTTPPTGPEGQGARLYATRLTFPLLLASRLPSQRARIHDIVTRAAADFQAAIAAGRATEVLDGENLP